MPERIRGGGGGGGGGRSRPDLERQRLELDVDDQVLRRLHRPRAVQVVVVGAGVDRRADDRWTAHWKILTNKQMKPEIPFGTRPESGQWQSNQVSTRSR